MVMPLTDCDRESQIDNSPTSAERQLTPQMCRGIAWTGVGLFALVMTVVFTIEALIDPGGWMLPIWCWPILLATGVVAFGVGFAMMVNESTRLQRCDAEVQDAFPQSVDVEPLVDEFGVRRE